MGRLFESAVPIAVAIAMLGLSIGTRHTKSQEEIAARGCAFHKMSARVSESAVFCVEPNTGVTHYYPSLNHHLTETPQ